jgi:DNA-nicking Smr family endonuclease
MNKNHKAHPNDDAETTDFASLFDDITPLTQDKIPPTKPKINRVRSAKAAAAEKHGKQQAASFAFSNGYEAYFDSTEALFWFREYGDERDKEHSAKTKRLRKGHFPPDIECDLHGLTIADAQSEIAALLFTAKKEHCLCVKIMHGHGTGRLKQAIPNWLVQHPDIIGFCQAPKTDGGNAAVLVLMDLPESFLR